MCMAFSLAHFKVIESCSKALAQVFISFLLLSLLLTEIVRVDKAEDLLGLHIEAILGPILEQL